MFGTLFLIAVPVEGFFALFKAFQALTDAKGILGAILILLFPGCLAFCMTASEFALLQRTSVVTLSICGIFKEVLTISTASIVFHDQLTPINGFGLVITICTIAAYNYIKIKAMRKELHSHDTGGYAPVGAEEEEDPESAFSADEDAAMVSSSTIYKAGKSRPAGLMATSLPGLSGSAGALDSPTRPSPVKRPEDLD